MSLYITDDLTGDQEFFAKLSDSVKLRLPKAGQFDPQVAALRDARNTGDVATIRLNATTLFAALAAFYEVRAPRILFEGARPLRATAAGSGELRGQYACRTNKITFWAHTAKKQQLVAFKTMLSTLTHEFCHHLDLKYFSLYSSFHTRGFYERKERLYARLLRQQNAPGHWHQVPDGRWQWRYTNPGRR